MITGLCFVFSLLFGLICSKIGQKKRMGPYIAFWWGFMVNIIGLIIVLASKSED